MLPSKSIKTLPFTFALNAELPLGLKPAAMPAGAKFKSVLFAPELTEPEAITVTELAAAAEIAVAWFAAYIPTLPELIVDPDATVTLVLPPS
jgi:hypothetical protein